MVLADKKTG